MTRWIIVDAIIDGYNLLHAIGLASRKSDATGLARARTRLLDWLADRGAGHTLLVVFDGTARTKADSRGEHRGVRWQFSTDGTADELIEELIRAENRPAKRTVVSNDRQVQDAARSRGCVVLTCEEFTDAMIAEPRRTAAPTKERSPTPTPTEAETAAWLEAFSKPKPRK